LAATNFGDSITDQTVKKAIGKRLGDITVPPDAVARVILFALEQPPEVDVDSIVILALSLVWPLASSLFHFGPLHAGGLLFTAAVFIMTLTILELAKHIPGMRLEL
jgi:hypothetical protein